MDQIELIQEIFTAVIELKTCIKGIDGGDHGLIGDVDEIKEEVEDLGKKHNRLSRNFWLLVGILIGTGLLGSGIYSLLVA